MARQIRLLGSIAIVPLTKGYEAVIDVDDVPLVEGRSWSALVSKPPERDLRGKGRPKGVQEENGFDAPPHLRRDGDVVCDHIDGDGLNNRKSNIRHCTRAENNLNTGLRSDNASGFKGVSFDKRVGKWRSEIQLHGRRHFLGQFSTPEEASAAYRSAAPDVHGEFARSSWAER